MRLDFQMEEKILCGVVLVIVIFLGTVVADQINVKLGEDCELQCAVPLGSVVLLRWRHSEKYFLLYRDGRFEKTHLKQRFELQDSEMKGGNLGLILKKVTLEDSGKYECVALVLTPEGKREEFTHHIELNVIEDKPVYQALMVSNNNEGVGQVSTTNEEKSDETEDQSRKHVTAVAVGVSVSLMFAFLVAGILLWKRKQIKEKWPEKFKNLNSNQTSSLEPLKPGSQA